MLTSDYLRIEKHTKQFNMHFDATYLVTGSTGFIGGEVVSFLKYLHDRGYGGIQLILPVRNIEKASRLFGNEDFISYVLWNMEDELNISEEVDYVIHAAGPVGFSYQWDTPYLCMKQHINGMFQLVQAIKHQKIQKCVFIGTGISYGRLLKERTDAIDEGEVGLFPSMDTKICYASGKLTAEYILACARKEYGIPVNVVRLFSGYGPRMNLMNGSVFSELYNALLSGKVLEIRGDGLPIRNFCYSTDLVVGIFYVLFLGSNGEAYNIGSETENYSIRELAEIMAESVNPVRQILIENQSEQSFVRSVQIPSVERIKKLGWHSLVTLKEGISYMNEYYKVYQ